MLARNLIPSMSTGITPLMAVEGRGDIFSGFDRAAEFSDMKSADLGNEDGDNRAMGNVRNLLRIRTILIARADRLEVEMCA